MKRRYAFTATLWIYPGGTAAWHFITVPKKESALIKKTFRSLARGWGSLPVSATIGDTTWGTSIFPDSKSGTYLLPVKAAVRRAEGIVERDTVNVALTIIP